jgi:hypothetical protein
MAFRRKRPSKLSAAAGLYIEAMEKYLVQGRGSSGRWLQAIYVLDDARPMTDREKRRWRRKR